jgi:Tol biopolymer transport system component
VDGSERQQLTFAPFETKAPRWSPDGKRIVFMGREPGKGWRIYLVPSEGGSNPVEVLAGDDSQAAPDWSPDGKSIVFGGLPEEISGESSATAIRLLDLKTHRAVMLPCPVLKGCTVLAGPRTDIKSQRRAQMDESYCSLILL